MTKSVGCSPPPQRAVPSCTCPPRYDHVRAGDPPQQGGSAHVWPGDPPQQGGVRSCMAWGPPQQGGSAHGHFWEPPPPSLVRRQEFFGLVGALARSADRFFCAFSLGTLPLCTLGAHGGFPIAFWRSSRTFFSTFLALREAPEIFSELSGLGTHLEGFWALKMAFS